MSSSAILESFIHANYPGMNLPPLWQVIYQEAIRGHHLLFRRTDVDQFDADMRSESAEMWASEALSDELEIIVLKLIGSSELKDMVGVIDALANETRQNLYVFYRRVLWMWRNYVKDNLN